MRRSLILLFVAAMLCIPLSLVSAQGDGTAITASIDQSASEDGLPMGDGKISTVEQQIGSEISRQMNAHEGVFAELEGIKDPRYAAIHGAQLWYDEYHKALEERGLTDKVDKLDQGEDVEAVDPDNTDLKENVEKIDDYTQEKAATGKLDPRAEAISGAVAQYGLPPPSGQPITKEQVVKTVRKGTNRAIDKAKLKYKNLTKRYINKILNRILTENDEEGFLPTNGYWRVHPFEIKKSGQCFDKNGDNGGMAPITVEKDPGQPLCGFRNLGGLPFITYNSGMYVYEPGTGNLYSEGSSTRHEVKYDNNGASVGTYNVTTTVKYQVISSTQIRVLLTIAEQGGCTMSADYLLELVTADNSICTAPKQLPTPIPTETPSNTGTQTPPTPEGPIKVEGPYRHGSPIFTDKKQCTEKNTPPDIGDIHIRPQTENTLLIDYGSGSQVVYRAGDNHYLFDSGMGGKSRTSISLTLLDDGAVSIFWSVNSKDGNICSFSQDFQLPPELRPTPTSTPEAQATPSSDSGADPDAGSTGSAGDSQPTMTAGKYKVSWMSLPGACPADMQPLAPTFTTVTLSFPDATTAVITFDGGEYTLVDSTGQRIYMLPDGTQGNLRYIVTLSSQPPDKLYLMWLASPADNLNVSCTAMAELSPS